MPRYTIQRRRTEHWVSICVVYCAADWDTMLNIQSLGSIQWTLTATKEQSVELAWNKMYICWSKSWECSRCNTSSFISTMSKHSQRGIWAQMSKVNSMCMQGFMFHLLLSSLSGYFLCGWLAGHRAEVTITWEGSDASTYSTPRAY